MLTECSSADGASSRGSEWYYQENSGHLQGIVNSMLTGAEGIHFSQLDEVL